MNQYKPALIAVVFIMYFAVCIPGLSADTAKANQSPETDSLKIYLKYGSDNETKDPALSIVYYSEALRIAESTGNYDEEINILKKLIDIGETSERPQLTAKFERDLLTAYKNKLAKENGAEKIPVLLAIGNESLNINTDSSLYYNNKAYELSKAYRIPNYIGQSLENLGNSYAQLNNQSKALEYYNNALKIFNSQEDSLSMAGLYWKIGKIYLGFKLYNQALEYELKSLKISRNINSLSWTYNSLRLLTTIYYQKNEPLKAKEYSNKLISIAKKNKDYPVISLLYFTLGKYYYGRKDYEYAIKNFSISAKLRAENKEPLDKLIISYENLGESFRKLKKYRIALSFFNKAYSLGKDLNYQILNQRILKELGITYKYLGDYKNSVHYLRESIKAAEVINYPKNIASGYEELSIVYSSQKDYKNAYSVLKKYLTIQDSLWSINFQKSVDQYKNIYMMEKKAKEYETLKTQSKNELLIAFTVIFVLLSLIFLILFSRYRYKVRSNKLLKKNAADISKALEEVNKLNEVLRISETTYRYLFENNPMPMLIWDNDTFMIKSANFAAMGLYGYTQEEFLLMSITDIFEKGRRDQSNFGRMSKYLTKLEDIKHVKKDGTDIDVEMIIHPLIFDGKKSYNAMINDVTEKKHIENAIIESERRLARAQKIAHVGNWEIDLATRMVWGSEEAFIIYGFDRKNSCFMNYDDIMNVPFEEEREKLDKAMFELLSNDSEYNLEFKIRKKDSGEVRVVRSTAEVIRGENGKPLKVTGVIRDITEIKDYQEELIEAKERAERSDKLKSDFLAQMSHEIRSPVNTILSFAALLKEELNGGINDDINICFNSIDSGGRRLIRTIDLILNMADIQSGKYEPFMEMTDIAGDIIKNLTMEFASAANAKGLSITFRNNLDHMKLLIDRYTVTQIFANLIDNAIKYTKKGGINIEMEESECGISVKITDTGIGISNEYLPRLFDPFSQEEQGYARRFEGTGLGLSLVKKYCALNNAEIKVESRKGEGTTFSIIFPLSAKVEA